MSNRHPALASREDAGLVIIDVQDAFAPVIEGFDDVVANCGLLAEGFGIMGRPVIVTEQYPKGLGCSSAAARASRPCCRWRDGRSTAVLTRRRRQPFSPRCSC